MAARNTAVRKKAAPRKSAPTPQPLVRDVSALRQTYLDCHAEGHQWRHIKGVLDPISVETGLRPAFSSRAVGRQSQCSHCSTYRVRWYTSNGETILRYRWPDGYLHKRSQGDDTPAPTRREWRMQLVTTLFDDIAS